MKELTILMPCLNEAKTIGACVEDAWKLIKEQGIDGEVLVSDNGSSDGSQAIASGFGARVINCSIRGYGAALQYGIQQAAGSIVLMGDSDRSYHFDEAMPMIESLRSGHDVCMGSRLRGHIEPGAMPLLNRYIGNPVLTAIGRRFFHVPLTDFHCGMRAFRKDKILELDLVTTGMEWASEMVIKAQMAGLKMTEVPITLHKDGRSRPPHLRRWRDGWRHLRFMLLHAPTWLFTVPGMAMAIAGLLGVAVLSRGMVALGGVRLDVHSLLVMAFLLILGVQIAFSGLFARVYSSLHGILPYDTKFDHAVRRLTLEKLLVLSLVLGALGAASFMHTFWGWRTAHFADLDIQTTMRQLIPALTLIAVSVQSIFNGFMLSILFLKTKRSKPVPLP